jgi:hypothetical protein
VLLHVPRSHQRSLRRKLRCLVVGSYSILSVVWGATILRLNGIRDSADGQSAGIQSKEYHSKFYIVPEFDKVSESAKELITRCFLPSNQRITPMEMLEHPWMQQTVQTNPNFMRSSAVVKFANANKFKVLVISFIAMRITDVQTFCTQWMLYSQTV